LDRLPTAAYSLPGGLMQRIWYVTIRIVFLSLIVWLITKRIERKGAGVIEVQRWSGKFAYLFTVFVLVQLVIMFNIPYNVGTIQRDISDSGTVLEMPSLKPSRRISQLGFNIDDRCEFNIYGGDSKQTILDYKGERIITSSEYEWELKQFGYIDPLVSYFNNKSRAIVHGGLDFFRLLNFSDCSVGTIPANFKYNERLFELHYHGVSPDGKYLLFQVVYGTHGFDFPFPGTEHDYSEADRLKTGLWIYNLNTEVSSQLKHLPIDTEGADVEDIEVEWTSSVLTIRGGYCTPQNCQYDLSKY
jgi:hypothetical protein